MKTVMLSSDADSLYWMSRYLERAEHTVRVLDVNMILMLDDSPTFEGERWERLLQSLNIARPEGALDAPSLTTTLTLDRTHRSSVIASITAARDNARQVREQISSEMWQQINRLYLRMAQTKAEDIWGGRLHQFFTGVREDIHLFQGIADATMTRNEGWHFMELGRFIERTVRSAGLLDTYYSDYLAHRATGSSSEYLDWVGLLKSRTAFEAYCQVYTADLRPERIAEFMLLNPDFPQTVHYAVRRIGMALEAINRSIGSRRGGELERIAARLRSQLQYAHIDEILSSDMHAFLRNIENQCGQMHALIQQLYISPPIESILAS
jgi:uncharacterized alpha-E superfamily protein